MTEKILITETKYYRIYRRQERCGIVYELDMLPVFGADFFETKAEAINRGEAYAEFVLAGPDARRR